VVALSMIMYMSSLQPLQSGGEDSGSDQVKSEVENLRDEIRRAANQEKNTTYDFDTEGLFIRFEGEADIVQIEHSRDSKMYSSEWSLISGTTLQGTSLGGGDFALDDLDNQSIVAAKSLPDSTSVYHIEFRETRNDTGSIQKIDIEESQTASNVRKIHINHTGTETVNVADSSGGKVQRTEKAVRLVLN